MHSHLGAPRGKDYAVGGKSEARGSIGVSEHSEINLANRIVCQLCYNHTPLGVYFLNTDSYMLIGLLKTTCPRFPITGWSQ